VLTTDSSSDRSCGFSLFRSNPTARSFGWWLVLICSNPTACSFGWWLMAGADLF
jgi:hypothetical protein